MRTIRLLAILAVLGAMRLAAQGVLAPSLLRQAGATDTQVLCWSDANSRWQPCDQTGGGASALDDLTDVTITAAATGEVLRYNGSAWVNTTLGTGDLPSGATLDTEWDTIAEIETATSVNIIVATEIDTEAELEALLGDVTNVFTNNDGALADDDLSDNAITDLSDVAAKSGNTTTVATTSGTLTSGDCVEFDANGNLVASGAACGSGGGSPGGSDTQVQYNSSGSFAGDSGFTYDGTGTLFVQDVTPSTGVTNVTFQGGAGQGTTNDVLTLKTAAGSDFVKFTTSNIFLDATVNFASTSASSERVAIASGVYIASSFPIRWSASSDASGTGDVGLERLAAGVLEVTNGSTGVGKLATGSIDVEDNGTRPTCDSSIRGTIWDDEGGAGVADDFSACVKSAADTYAWSSLIGAGGGASALDDLTDVTITTVGSGDLLRYNGSAWVNTTLGTGDLPSGATLDTEWDTAAEINAATTDDDFVTLTGAETLSSGTKTLTAKLDAGGGTIEIPNSTSLPGTCAVGDAYMDTDATSGQRFYLCESANTWALQGDGGPADTDGLPEGSTNLYYTDARARSGVIAAAIQGASSTNMILQAGGSQTGDLLALKNAAGSDFVKFTTSNIFLDATVNFASTSASSERVAIASGVYIASSFPIRWSASSDASGTGDVGLSRASAGLLRVNNGATTTTNGALEAGDLTVYDNTATTGVTTAVVKAGAGQSATDLTQWQNNAGSVLARVRSDGDLESPNVLTEDTDDRTTGFIGTDTAEAGTTTTNLNMTAHGLSTGQLICNTTRSACSLVTVVDADNVTTSTITGQASGDSIRTYDYPNRRSSWQHETTPIDDIFLDNIPLGAVQMTWNAAPTRNFDSLIYLDLPDGAAIDKGRGLFVWNKGYSDGINVLADNGGVAAAFICADNATPTNNSFCEAHEVRSATSIGSYVRSTPTAGGPHLMFLDQQSTAASKPTAMIDITGNAAHTGFNVKNSGGNTSVIYYQALDSEGDVRFQMSGNGIELGDTGDDSASTTFDFHSGSATADYDVRLLSTGGAGTAGAGTLTFYAATVDMSGLVLKADELDLDDAGTKPTCDASQRGKIWYDEGASGVADTAEICGKDASDVYAWVAIATF